MRTTVATFVLACFSLLSSCQSVVPSLRQEPLEESVSQDLTLRFVHQLISDLRDSYIARDVQGFMKHVSHGFYGGRAKLQKDLERSFAAGRHIVNVDVGSMEVEERQITAVVRWTISAAGKGVESGEKKGETILVFLRDETVTLVDLRKDPLFGIEGL